MELDTFSGQYSSATPLSYKPIRFHKTEICKKKMIKIFLLKSSLNLPFLLHRKEAESLKHKNSKGSI